MNKLSNRLLVLLIILAHTVLAQDKEGGLFIDPATIDFSLMNGQNSTTQITILNKLNVKKQFTIYINDWNRDTIGKHVYSEPGTNMRSCSRWLTIDKNFVEVDPGESATINVKLSMPDSAEAVKQMRWAMVFIESMEEKKAPTKVEGVTTNIQTKFRVGVHVYQTPPTKVNKEIRMLAFNPVTLSQDSIYRIECQNTGDIQVKCKGAIELSSLADGKKVTLDPVQFPLFPDQKRYIDFVIPKTLAKGKYTVMATVDAGEDIPLEAAQKIIEIK